MNAQTDMACRAVIVARSALGSFPNAITAPRKTPNTPVVEFPALNRVVQAPKMLLLTAPLGAAKP